MTTSTSRHAERESQSRRKLAAFDEPFRPKIVGYYNGNELQVAKTEGEFVWHSHPETDRRWRRHPADRARRNSQYRRFRRRGRAGGRDLSLEVRLLGSGGWLPTETRRTACVYLRDGSEVLVLDAGSGFARLLTEPELLDGVERLSVVLTHFHLDHTNGLAVLPGLSHVPVREVWAPGRLVAGVPAPDLVRRLLGPPFLVGAVEDVESRLVTQIHELTGDVSIGSLHVRTRLQPLHVGPTFALRVGDELAYCTDTAYDEDNVAFAEGVRVLLHEAFHAADETDDATHSASGEAGRIARSAGVERLVLVHVNPLLKADEELLRSAAAVFPASEVGRDGALA